MRRIILAVLFLLLWTLTAFATQITVSSVQVPNWRWGGSTAKLRIYCDQSFVTNDGINVLAGSPNKPGGFYTEVSVTISGTNATIASFTINSTTNGQNITSAKYSAFFFNTNGQLLGTFSPYTNFFISADQGTSQTWQTIALYNFNQAAPPELRFTFDDDTIQRKFNEFAASSFINPLTTAGDIIYSSGGPTAARLAIGSSGQFLRVSAGLPAWQTLASADITTALGFTPASLAGATFTGAVTLAADPTTNLQAATKQYVDNNKGIQSLNGLTSASFPTQTFAVGGNFPNLTIASSAGAHTFNWTGQLAVARGGLGLSTVAAGDLLYGSATDVYSRLTIGSANTVLKSNGSIPSWGLVDLTLNVSGILPAANGGTANGFTAFTGPTTSTKTFTLPNASTTILTTNAAVTVAQGGIGITSGTIGDLLYFSASTTISKLAVGTNNQILKVVSGLPAWSSLNVATDITGVLAIANGGTGQSSFAAGYLKSNGSTLSSQAVPIPIADGGTNATGSGYSTNGVAYYTGSAVTTTALGASGTVLTGTGAAPAFSASPTLTGLTLSGLTSGSILFAGTAGVISQNNSRLSWDNSGFILSVQGDERLLGATSGYVGIKAPGSVTSYTLTFPGAAPVANGKFLSFNTDGTSSFVDVVVTAITSINGQTTAAQLLTIATTGATSPSITQVSTNENKIIIPLAGVGVSAGLLTNASQTLYGAKTLNDTLTVPSGTSTAAPIVFACSSCALLSTPSAGALEYDAAKLYITVSSPSLARKEIMFTTTSVQDSQLSSNVQLKTERNANNGYAGLNSSGAVALAQGGLGTSLVLGATGTFLRSTGSAIDFSADGSSLTNLNASQLLTGTISATILGNSGALQTSDIGATNSTKAVAGLTNAASPKLILANMQEVMGVADLTDYSGKSGSGTTAIGSTITSVTDGQLLAYDSVLGYWKNVNPGAASGHSILSATHTDTNTGTVSQGDLLYGNATPKWDRLPVGGANTVLRSNGTTIAWGNIALGTDVTGILGISNGGTGQSTATAAFNGLDPLTTAGDLLAHNGTDSVRIGVGTTGQILVADPSGPNPKVKWDSILALAQGTITSDAPHINTTVTWNAGGVTFTAWKLNVTDTASAAGSLLADLQVGGSSKFKVDKTGTVTLATALPIASGGTGQTTQTAAFNGLDPLTTRGDLLTHNGTDSIRLAVGAANRVLRSDGTDPSWAQVALATDVSGALPVANGGTNLTSYTALDLIYASGATTLAKLAVGTANQVLGVNSGATGFEYKSLLGTTNQITVTHGANSVTFDIGANVLTNSSTHTLTNKTYDAEATGNVFTFPVKIWFSAALNDAGSAVTLFDLPTTNAPAVTALTGTNTVTASLDFDQATDESAQVSFMLPSDWTGAIDASVLWKTTSASTNSVVWEVACGCGTGNDPAFNSTSSVTTANAAANTDNTSSVTGITTTGCAAGEMIYIKINRDANNGSDNLAADAQMRGLVVTLRRGI